MTHTEGHLQVSDASAGAGAKLYYQAWQPAKAKAVIMLIHGYAEHGGRYAEFAEICGKDNYAVYAVDHWGHGKSGGARGFVPKFSAFLDGVDALLTCVQENHPSLPIVLVGHSMGGLISTRYLIQNQEAFAAAVLSGPAIIPTEEPSKALLFVSRLMSKLAPKVGVLALDSDSVSRDPAVVKKYLDDPLVYNGKMSARLAAEMLTSMQDAQGNLSKITLPILCLHGEEDGLAAPEGSTLIHEAVSSKDKTLKIYPELYHEIFNEPERKAVLSDMTNWLNARLPA